MHVLPDELRDKLKEHIGYLVDEQGLLTILKDKKRIVSVGDRVTFTLLAHGIQPMICIVDYILERKPYPSEMKAAIQTYGKPHIRVQNPQGTITEDLWNAIKEAYIQDKYPVCIEVEGEEDLASLAAIYLAPRDVTVIYGLPNKGVVVVEATEAHKRKVKAVLDSMR